MRSRDSRSLILAAAQEEFKERGFAGGRVERIAQRAGVNKQLIFYYFESKAGLFRATVNAAAENVAGAQRSVTGTRIRDTLAQLFALLSQRPDEVELLIQAIRSPESAAQPVQQLLLPPLNQVRSAITAGQGVGAIRDDVDPDAGALHAVVLILGYLALEPIIPNARHSAGREAWVSGAADLLTRAWSW